MEREQAPPAEPEETKQASAEAPVSSPGGSVKRFKIDEEGDGQAVPKDTAQFEDSASKGDINDANKLLGAKRMSSRELKYINQDNIIPNANLPEEEHDDKDDVDKEAIKKCAQRVGEYFK